MSGRGTLTTPQDDSHATFPFSSKDAPPAANVHAPRDGQVIAAVLVMAAKRDKALRNHMEQLVRLRPWSWRFPIIISQDGSDHSVAVVASEFSKKYENISHIMKKDNVPRLGIKNYGYIAAHYRWALDKVFNEMEYDYVIVTEDDLDIAHDFFSYFMWGKQVLAADPTVWCISAWNDNGLPNLVNEDSTAKVWRTDFFPGLGWMLRKELWSELSPNFPEIYWDDWMRKSEVRKGRSCLRPEISRTAHNMKVAGKGSSGGLYKAFLNNIAVNSHAVNFMLLPYENLMKKRYDTELQLALRDSKPVAFNEFDSTSFSPSHSYIVTFSTTREWFTIAQKLGIMSDIRSGMQRTAYYGVVPVMHKKCRLYLVPVDLDLSNMEAYQYDQIRDIQLRFLEFEKTYCNKKLYTGVCDPNSPEMIAWFKSKKWMKRLQAYGPMMVN
ncbi:hypothetical protein Q1695_001111 [Nippostrongylus brasiliensis]|nr:hypothetical protein Q1695_001111 [Nippostrongylus brasiliensis]